MNGRSEFETRESFLERLRELRAQGVAPERIRVLMPVPVGEAEPLLRVRPSRVRFFTLAGGLTGLATGFVFTILTVVHWPLNTGGKTLISLPPFVIIAFELTILLGALASLGGFLLLARLPSARGVLAPEEHGNRFVIVVEEERR
jgi:hypothetical protein